MTIKYELTKLFRRKELIPRCIYPECYKVRINNEWIDCRKNYEYKNYTGSLCDEHLEEAIKYNKIEKELLSIKNEKTRNRKSD